MFLKTFIMPWQMLLLCILWQMLLPQLWQMLLPYMCVNRVKLRSQAPAMKKNKGITNNVDPNTSRNLTPHIVVPYHQGLSECFKGTCKKYGIQVHLKGGPTIRNLLSAPKDKDPIFRRVESYIDTNVTGWNVMIRASTEF